jgi:hypothetical protein
LKLFIENFSSSPPCFFYTPQKLDFVHLQISHHSLKRRLPMRSSGSLILHVTIQSTVLISSWRPNKLLLGMQRMILFGTCRSLWSYPYSSGDFWETGCQQKITWYLAASLLQQLTCVFSDVAVSNQLDIYSYLAISLVRSWIGFSSVEPQTLSDHFLQFTF